MQLRRANCGDAREAEKQLTNRAVSLLIGGQIVSVLVFDDYPLTPSQPNWDNAIM
jgi:hypothetical protein